eukprot:1594163-Prymnesium_polylepis.1
MTSLRYRLWQALTSRTRTGLRASSRTGVIKLQVSDSVCFCAMPFAVSFGWALAPAPPWGALRLQLRP